MKIHTALCLATFLGAVPVSQAMAQSMYDRDITQPASPWYAGFGLSRSDASIESASLNAISGGASVGDIDDRFNGFQAYLGYEFNRYLALEVGGGRIGTTTVGYSNGQSVQYRMSVFFADVLGIFPFGEKWALFGRAGAAVSQTRLGLINSLIVLTAEEKDDTDVKLKFGGGAQYYFTPGIGGRLEYARYKVADPLSNDAVKVDSLAASIFFRF